MKKLFLVLTLVLLMCGSANAQISGYNPQSGPGTGSTWFPEYIKIGLRNATYVLVRKTDIVKLNVFFGSSGWQVEIYIADAKWKESGRGNDNLRRRTLEPLLTKSFPGLIGTDITVVPPAVTTFVNSIIPTWNVQIIP